MGGPLLCAAQILEDQIKQPTIVQHDQQMNAAVSYPADVIKDGQLVRHSRDFFTQQVKKVCVVFVE